MSKPRRPIVAGNWKMHKNVGAAVDLAAEVKRGVGEDNDVDVVLCPPFTALKSVGDLLRFSSVKLGAQNMHWEASGAFTGEVSAGMLRDLGCDYVIIGHSERRTLFGETDENVERKTLSALDGGLCPIVCVGETLEEREAEQTETVLARQIDGGLGALAARLAEVVVAYEPVWAIGTGKNGQRREMAQAGARLHPRRGSPSLKTRASARSRRGTHPVRRQRQARQRRGAVLPTRRRRRADRRRRPRGRLLPGHRRSRPLRRGGRAPRGAVHRPRGRPGYISWLSSSTERSSMK